MVIGHKTSASRFISGADTGSKSVFETEEGSGSENENRSETAPTA